MCSLKKRKKEGIWGPTVVVVSESGSGGGGDRWRRLVQAHRECQSSLAQAEAHPRPPAQSSDLIFPCHGRSCSQPRERLLSCAQC